MSSSATREPSTSDVISVSPSHKPSVVARCESVISKPDSGPVPKDSFNALSMNDLPEWYPPTTATTESFSSSDSSRRTPDSTTSNEPWSALGRAIWKTSRAGVDSSDGKGAEALGAAAIVAAGISARSARRKHSRFIALRYVGKQSDELGRSLLVRGCQQDGWSSRATGRSECGADEMLSA